MTDTFIDPSSQTGIGADPHADKYNDPRAKVTPRGLLLVALVIVLGIIGAAGSIYARRTRLEKTTEFWGAETITALQLGERIQMLSLAGRQFDPVELTHTPGLGHLRRLLLDERNYDWSSVSGHPVTQHCQGDDPLCVQLKLSDPTAKRFEPIELTIDLQNGWLGNSEGTRCLQIADRKRTALRKFLEQLITVQQQRYDHR
jgi:hypothetical protein